jgi:hypothetical protein
MSQDIGMTLNLNGFGVVWFGVARVSGRLVVAGWVDGEFSEELAGDGAYNGGTQIPSNLPAITATVSQIAQSAGLCGRY